jgi:hypothetical protein
MGEWPNSCIKPKDRWKCLQANFEGIIVTGSQLPACIVFAQCGLFSLDFHHRRFLCSIGSCSMVGIVCYTLGTVEQGGRMSIIGKPG